MQEIIQRFWGFDKLIGPVLVKIVYYFGLALILLGVCGGMLMGLLSFFGGNFGGGVVQLIAVPTVGLVALVYWRFISELFILAFRSFEVLVEIRDRLPPPITPSHPQF